MKTEQKTILSILCSLIFVIIYLAGTVIDLKYGAKQSEAGQMMELTSYAPWEMALPLGHSMKNATGKNLIIAIMPDPKESK